MAEIGDVYGNDFNQQSQKGKMEYAVKLIGTNIAHRKFTFRHDSNCMWQSNNMKTEAINMLLLQVQRVNPKFRLTHVKKTSDKINMFPFLINGPVEYFVLTDLAGDQVQIFSIYITPGLMEAF